MKFKLSTIVLLFGCLSIFWTSFFYYPKWTKSSGEATIGWDASGYYWYLPGIFIYKEIRKMNWADTIHKKYEPSPNKDQYFEHVSGNRVCKYSLGLAIQELPFFLIAHMIAPKLGFPADGFSRPYQFMIQLGGMLFAFFGLYLLRKILLRFFSDVSVAAVLFSIILGSNYMMYSALWNSMTHSWLFTWYVILLYFTIHFYKDFSWKSALGLGFCIGIMTLTRPTEIVAGIIPVLWGMNGKNISGFITQFSERIKLLWHHLNKVIGAIVILCALGSLQFFYWKYATGDWIVYSYQDQGFSFLHPYIYLYTLSARSGWLVFTPIMIFGIIGFYFLWKKALSFWAIFLFCFVNWYIVCSWDIWWYGGRAMVQSYAVFAFPMAAIFEYSFTKKWWRWIVSFFILLFSYISIWSIYSGNHVIEQTTNQYLRRMMGRWEPAGEKLKLLDTKEMFEGPGSNQSFIFSKDFRKDTIICPHPDIMKYCDFVGSNRLNSSVVILKKEDFENIPLKKWIRVSATFRCTGKEWDICKMPQFFLRCKNGDESIKEAVLKPHRFFDNDQTKNMTLEMKTPTKPFDRMEINLSNPGSGSNLLWLDAKVETFDE
jgi:hypothetical protein